MENKLLLWVMIVVGVLLAGITVWSVGNIDNEGMSEADKTKFKTDIATMVLSNIPQPATAEEIAANVVIPGLDVPEWDIPEFKGEKMVEDLWEDMYSDEIDEIESEVEYYAMEELEDHDYKVIVKYMMVLIEEIDEDSIDVYVDDWEVTVTELGLEEDDDKSARVTYEIEVDYEVRVESEYGYTIEDYSKDLVVTYDVTFDEGDFSDEEVELVSIV